MTWGALYMYYHCPKCGMIFEYALDVMTEFGDEFGFCPECRRGSTVCTLDRRKDKNLQYEWTQGGRRVNLPGRSRSRAGRL